MTPTQYRAALARLDLSQVGAARLVKVDGRTSRKWIAGAARIPEAVAILLRLLLAGTITIEDVEEARR